MAITKKFCSVFAAVMWLSMLFSTNSGVDAALQAHASHILVDTEAEIDAIHADLNTAKNLFARFAEIAKTKSKCPSGKRGGDLGTFGRGRMVPEFDRVVFEEEVGMVHKVKTQFGWHLVLTSSVTDDDQAEESGWKRTALIYLNQAAPFLGPVVLFLIFFLGGRSGSKSGVQARASHILVNTEEEVDALVKEIKEAPKPIEKLAELAKTKSKCPSGKGGGDLGAFGRGQMVPQFDKVVFEEEVGQVHKVQTQFGWHVLICTQRSGDEKKAE